MAGNCHFVDSRYRLWYNSGINPKTGVISVKKRIIIIAACFALVLSAALFAAFGLPNEPEPIPERLSAERAAELRAEYPLRSPVPQLINMIIPTLDTVIERSETFVYARVTESVINTFRYRQGELEVIQDTGGVFREGGKIRISINGQWGSVVPFLNEGMEMIINIPGGKEINDGLFDEGIYTFSTFGMFYVLEGGYCFSLYNIEDAVALDGTHVREMMEKRLRKR